MGESTLALVGEYVPGDEIVPRILGAHVVRKPAHHREAIFPLIRRWRQRGPIDRRLPPHMGLGAVSCIAGKVAQQSFLHLQLEAGRSPYRDIAVNGLAQHDRSPSTGHGWVTSRNSASSTLA